MANIKIPHNISYNVNQPSSIKEIAASLTANESLIFLALQVLDECYPDFNIEDVKVNLSKASQNSPLEETYYITFLATAQQAIAQNTPPLIEHFMGAVPSIEINNAVAAIILGLAIGMAKDLYKGLAKAPDILTKKQNSYVEKASKTMEVPTETIIKLLDKFAEKTSYEDKKKIVTGYFSPARRQEGGEIKVQNDIVDRETIIAVPFEAELEDDVININALDVLIDLHAKDKDRKGRGWAAVISEITDDRKWIKIEKTMDQSKLFEINMLRGDVIVSYKRESNGSLYPSHYTLVSINKVIS